MRVATTGPTLTHKVVLSLAICAGLGWGGRCVFKSCDEWQGLLLLFCIRAMFTNHGDMKSNLISAYHFIGVKLTKETRWTCNMKALYIIMFFLYAIANHCTTVQFLDINIWCSSCVLSGPFECMHLTYFFWLTSTTGVPYHMFALLQDSLDKTVLVDELQEILQKLTVWLGSNIWMADQIPIPYYDLGL